MFRALALRQSDYDYEQLRLRAITITNHSEEELTLETSAFLLFIVANLRFQPSC